MMNNDLENKSIQQLETNLILMKVISIALFLVLLLLIGISIYGISMKGDSYNYGGSFVIKIGGFFILLLLLVNMKKIKKELNTRKGDNKKYFEK